jgi:hypothetical protein
MPTFRLEVNGTERDVALPTMSVQHVVNGPDILEGDIQDDDGSIALVLDQVVVLYQTDVSPETVYFEGLLQTKGNNTWTGHGYARLRKITAFDYSVYTTFVDASLETDGTDSLSDALQSLVTDHLADYGVTLDPSQATGPTIEPNSFAGVKAQAILNSLSEQTGWVWKIDASKQLRMWDPATEAADFNVTADNDTYLQDIATNELRQRSYNRVFVEGGEGYHTFVNEQHFGDGSKTTFEINAPMHYFEVDYTSTLGFMVGLQLTVVRSGGTTIEYANDQGTAQWMVTNYDGSTGTFRDNPSLVQISGATLGPTEYILFTYAGKYPFRLVADGRGSPPVPPRDLTLYRPLVFNRAALQAIADQVLAASLGDFERITYPTRTQTTLRPGQTQTVNVPEAGVNGTYTCTSARLRYEPGGDTSEFWLDVTSVNEITARSFWLNLLDRWLTDNQGTASAASTNSIGSTVIPQGAAGPIYAMQYKGTNGQFAGNAFVKVTTAETGIEIGSGHTISGDYHLVVGQGHTVS